MKNRFFAALMSIALFFSLHVQGNPFSNQETIKAEMINIQLAKQFPIEKTFDGITAVFTEPAIEIDILDQTVEIHVKIVSRQGDNELIARASLVGTMEYYEFEQTIRYKKPVMDDFIVVKDTLEDSRPVVRVIRQSMATFRDITLFELDNLKRELSKKEPSEIEISFKKLILHY